MKVEGDYKGDDYIGKRDGVQYRLVFDTYEAGAFQDIDLFPYHQEDVYPDELKGEMNPDASGDDIKLESENKCKVTKAEAEKTAREFLQNAGFTDLILAEEQTLKWTWGKTEAELNTNSLIDGWYFTFSPGVEDAPFSDYADFYDYTGGVGMSETEIVSDERFSSNCSITVSVTDKGVIEAKIGNPIIFISSTPGVKLLPLEDIKKIIRDGIGEFAEFNHETREVSCMNFNRLTLGYYRASDPEHKDMYTYVPVWRLWSNSGNALSFVVNAMDGSVMKDWTEKRKVVSRTADQQETE